MKNVKNDGDIMNSDYLMSAYITLMPIVFPLLVDLITYMKFKDKLGLTNKNVLDILANFVQYKHEKVLGHRNTALFIILDVILAIPVILLVYYTKFNVVTLVISTVIYLYLIYLIRYRAYTKSIKITTTFE